MFAPIRFFMTMTGLVLIGITMLAFVFSGHLEGWSRLWLEDTLSRSYGTRVEIDRLSFAPLEFGAVAEDVRIYNPEGFDPGVAIAMDRVVFRPDYRTLFTDRLTLDLIKFDNLQVSPQQFFKNLQVIGDNARIAVETGEAPGLNVRQIAVNSGQMNGIVPVKLHPFESDRVEAGMAAEGDEIQAELLKSFMMSVVSFGGVI